MFTQVIKLSLTVVTIEQSDVKKFEKKTSSDFFNLGNDV